MPPRDVKGPAKRKVRRRAEPIGPPAPKRVVRRVAGPAGLVGKQITDPKAIQRRRAEIAYDERLRKQTGGRKLSEPLPTPVTERGIRSGKVAGPSVTSSKTATFRVKAKPRKIVGVTVAPRTNEFDVVRGGKTISQGSYTKRGKNFKSSDVNTAIAKVTTPVLKDYVEIPANIIPSTYHVAKTAVTGHPKEAGEMLLEPYKQLVKDPVGSFKEHPLGTTLLVAGPKGLVGRGAGRVARAAPKGSLVQRAASLERAPKTIEGTTLRQERTYSPDVITKAGQVAHEKARVRKVTRLRQKSAKVLRTGKEDRADELMAKAKAADPTRMSAHEVRRRVDARVDANEIIRRQNRAKVLKQVDDVLPKKGKEAVPLVAQNIVRADPADFAKYRAEIKEAAPNRPGRARQNKELRKQIRKAEKAPDMKAVEKAARDYQGVVKPLQDKLVAAGMVGAEAADMSPLIPYATRHMGAKFVKEHYRDASGRKLSGKEVRQLRETHTPADFQHVAQKVPGRLTVEGKPVTAPEIRSHMQAAGFKEPAYVTQAPGTRGARNYYVAQHEAPHVSTRQRTGEATRKGTFDAHPDVLREGAARMQGLVDAHEGYAKFVGELAHRGSDKEVRTFDSHAQAKDHAADLAETTGVQWRPVKLKPFAGRHEQLRDLLDRTHPDNHEHVADLTKALEDAVESDSGPGPWALVPNVAADQLSQHVRVMGSGAGGKTLQAVSSAFRRTVLSTSAKWLFGNVAEAGTRSAVGRAGPRSYVTGKRIVKRLEKVDPEAAQELQARALGGGHFAMADRMPARRAEQFKDTRMEPMANALAAFWRAPGAKQVAGAWKGYTDFVFHKVNQPLESRFQKAMLGSEVRRTLMDGKAVKLSKKAIDEAAEGLRDTNTQARFAEAVDQMYGRYSKFSPSKRRLVALYTPFIAWTFNAVEFVSRVLPRDHPVLTSLLVSAHQASEEWRKEHGLDKFMEGRVPDFLQGSVPTGESKLRASRYTPFGLYGDPLNSFGNAVLPQFSGVLSAFKGEDWKGKKLRDANGQELDELGKAREAAKAFAEATVPLAGKLGQIAQGQSLRDIQDPLKPVAPKKKVKRSSGGWGGGSVGPSKSGWGG